MKKYLLAFVCLIGVWTSATACDVCSCSSGASYMGTMPQLNRSFIGLRYGYKSYRISHMPSLSGQTYAPTTEYFNTMELWGRFFPLKRLQILAMLPFTHYHHGSTGSFGMGDASLMAGYMVYNNGDSIGKTLKQTFTINGGVKLPTGQYRKTANGERLSPAMQPGTGSVDFLANVFYSIRYKKIGFAADATYKINTANADHYRYGDRFNFSGKAFVWLRSGWVSILPSVGAGYEYATHDSNNKYRVNLSGGQAVFGHVGLDVYYRNIGIIASAQMPVAYSYNGGLTKPQPRINLQFFFTI